MVEPPRIILHQQHVMPVVAREMSLPAVKPPIPGEKIIAPALPVPAVEMPPATLPMHDPYEHVHADSAPARIRLADSMPGGSGNNGDPVSLHTIPLPAFSGPGHSTHWPAKGDGSTSGHGTGMTGSGSGNSKGDEHGMGTGSGRGLGAGAGAGAGVVAKNPVVAHALPRGTTCPAAITNQVKPLYPTTARHDGVEGTVLLRVTLNPQGKIEKVEVITSSRDMRLDDAAIQAIKESTYSPRCVDGHAVPSTIRVRVTFNLQDAD